jgi:long-subunit fatty acid transport protein
MIKFTRLLFTLLFAVIVLNARAQSTATTSSPYSRYGLGDISNQLLPQNIGMGGIAAATNIIGGYNSINVINPASYGKINLTTIDIGVSSDITTFSKIGNADQRNTNFKLSHLLFAFPVTKTSALSFGLLPYSQLGYNYKTSKTNFGTGSSVDTNAVNYIYSGEGSLSKAYLGYGITLFKHLMVGANFSYIFGSLKQYQSTEVPSLYGVLDSRAEQDNHVKGVNFDYGAQYTFDLSEAKHITLGYSASVGSKLNVNNTYIVSQYTRDASGNESSAIDSLVNQQNPNGKIQLPHINRFGIVYQYEGKFLVGADYTMGKWSDLSIAGTNAGLQDSKMFNVGGQWTPNINALNNYFALIDYRLGFLYEQTYLNVNNVNIKRYAVTFGLGVPLPHDRASSAFYKVNFSAEIGQRGQLAYQLIKENYVNLHLGFTLNDRWFQRFKFE